MYISRNQEVVHMFWKKTKWMDWKEFQQLQKDHEFFKTVDEEVAFKMNNIAKRHGF